MEISTLKPNEDELHKFAFEMHCAEVYDMLCEDNVRQAEGLFYSDRFWTVAWQVECRQRQREKLFYHLETLVSEEASRQVQKQGVRKMVGMRSFLFERFGAGQPEVLEARVRHYLDGMPDPKTGLVFPPLMILRSIGVIGLDILVADDLAIGTSGGEDGRAIWDLEYVF